MSAPAISRNVNRGVELGYAEITSDFNATAEYPTSAAVTGLSVDVVVGSRPIMIYFNASQLRHSVNTGITIVSFFEDGTECYFARVDQHATAGERAPFFTGKRRAPAAGTHTYAIKIGEAVDTAGTMTLSGAVGSESYIQVVEI